MTAQCLAVIGVFSLALLACCGSVGTAAESSGHCAAYTLVPDEHGMVLKTPDGRTVFRYMTRKPAQTKLTANSVCCLYPVKTPTGEEVVDFAPEDHPHHRGVFFAWHAMAGKTPADFWGWGEWAPTKDRVITNRSVKLLSATAEQAVVEVRNDWVAEGNTLVEELTTITASERVVRTLPLQSAKGGGPIKYGAFVIDFDFRLTPKEDITLRQTAFSGFCAKCRKDGKGVYSDPKGKVELPNPHHLKPESNWPAQSWYDYSVQLANGRTVGVAIVDHPDNPPTSWHNLAPIAMLNPCIVAPGEVKLKANQPLRLRYRLVAHDGPAPLELLNKTLAPEFRGKGAQ